MFLFTILVSSSSLTLPPHIRTPLHCAASCNNVQVCKFLVESGAAVFAMTYSDMQTAADKCEEMEEGYTQCSQFLYGQWQIFCCFWCFYQKLTALNLFALTKFLFESVPLQGCKRKWASWIGVWSMVCGTTMVKTQMSCCSTRETAWLSSAERTMTRLTGGGHVWGTQRVTFPETSSGWVTETLMLSWSRHIYFFKRVLMSCCCCCRLLQLYPRIKPRQRTLAWNTRVSAHSSLLQLFNTHAHTCFKRCRTRSALLKWRDKDRRNSMKD